MKWKQYISVMAVAAGLACAQKFPVEQDPREQAAPTSAAPSNEPGAPEPKAPTQDFLNMKGQTRPAPLKYVTIEQKLNSQLPLDAVFTDENGTTAPLGKYFGKRPVVLALVYYDCPMLCTQILNGLVRSLKVISFKPGEEFDVVAISFDAREKPDQARAKKAVYMKDYGHPETASAFHFLTGGPAEIKRVTDAVGFRYSWDPHTGQFAHASAVYVLTPEGKLSKYFYGIEYSPKDMRLGLVEASQNKIGNPVDQVLLFCYHFDPKAAKYTPVAMGILRVAGVATIVTLGGFVLIMLRRDQKQKGIRPA